MYRSGEIIVGEGEPVDQLVVVSRGSCNLYGYFQDMKGADR